MIIMKIEDGRYEKRQETKRRVVHLARQRSDPNYVCLGAVTGLTSDQVIHPRSRTSMAAHCTGRLASLGLTQW